jgi:hypothetical protein
MVIISPYSRHGVLHQQTTNVGILSFMQKLWGMPPLTTLNARQNNLFDAFDFSQPPLPAHSVPIAPGGTIAFHGSQANLTVSFPAASYYRIAASGPNGSKGWVTVDVGATPNTAP